MNDLINKLNVYFGQKAPQIPKDIKEIIVKIAPWLVVISALVTLPAALAVMGLHRSLPWAYGYGYSSGFSTYAIISLVTVVLYIIALPGLFKQNASGWNFSFYAVLVQAVGSLLAMNIGSLVLGLLIGLYILFQIKPYYFGQATITPASPTPPTPPSAGNSTNNQTPQQPQQ